MSPELFYPGCKVHGRNSAMLQDDEDDDDEEDVDNLSERDALNPAASADLPEFGYPENSPLPPPQLPPAQAAADLLPPYDHSNCTEQLHKSCACVNFIAEHTKAREEATKVRMAFYQCSGTHCNQIVKLGQVGLMNPDSGSLTPFSKVLPKSVTSTSPMFS